MTSCVSSVPGAPPSNRISNVSPCRSEPPSSSMIGHADLDRVGVHQAALFHRLEAARAGGVAATRRRSRRAARQRRLPPPAGQQAPQSHKAPPCALSVALAAGKCRSRACSVLRVLACPAWLRASAASPVIGAGRPTRGAAMPTGHLVADAPRREPSCRSRRRSSTLPWHPRAATLPVWPRRRPISRCVGHVPQANQVVAAGGGQLLRAIERERQHFGRPRRQA